ncbi:hypothetical protein M501DRAFT_471468 [Patellaria atrata CBS 101060]|uniref:Uncharacterized protein n=1 Tax=Patellaria atrata CBS 101060 TaxID=1346257 RepID=A0A9P4VJG5_9PEZI|nr:hypothetical protein M501DRAFT_471468 [Patellaria atrata CBS 101060]
MQPPDARHNQLLRRPKPHLSSTLPNPHQGTFFSFTFFVNLRSYPSPSQRRPLTHPPRVSVLCVCVSVGWHWSGIPQLHVTHLRNVLKVSYPVPLIQAREQYFDPSMPRTSR